MLNRWAAQLRLCSFKLLNSSFEEECIALVVQSASLNRALKSVSPFASQADFSASDETLKFPERGPSHVKGCPRLCCLRLFFPCEDKRKSYTVGRILQPALTSSSGWLVCVQRDSEPDRPVRSYVPSLQAALGFYVERGMHLNPGSTNNGRAPKPVFTFFLFRSAHLCISGF